MNQPLTRDDLADLFGRSGIGAEVGVQKGDYAAVLLERTKPIEMHLIDCWEQQSEATYGDDPANVPNLVQEDNFQHVMHRFSGDIGSGRVIVHRGYSTDILPGFDRDYFDFIYIDANHRFDSVLRDLQHCENLVKRGGLLCGHDYLLRDGWGVVQAVETFLQNGNYMFQFLTQCSEFPSFGLRRIK
jgi:hypothetical protein